MRKLFDKYNTKELKITEHKFHKSTLMEDGTYQKIFVRI